MLLRKMVGLVSLMAGLAAIAASSGCGFRASSADVAGLPSRQALPAHLTPQPSSHEGTGSEATDTRKSCQPLLRSAWQRPSTCSSITSASRTRTCWQPCSRKWSRQWKPTSSPSARLALQRSPSNRRTRPSKVARLQWRSRRTRSPSWKRQPRRQTRRSRRQSRKPTSCKGKLTSYRKSTTRSWLASPKIRMRPHTPAERA